MFDTSSIVYQLFPVLKLLCAVWILWFTHLLNSVVGMIRFVIVMGVYPLSALFQFPCPIWWLLSFGWWWGATEVHHQSGHLPTPAPAHSQYLVRSMLCVQSFVNVFINQFCCKFFSVQLNFGSRILNMDISVIMGIPKWFWIHRDVYLMCILTSLWYHIVFHLGDIFHGLSNGGFTVLINSECICWPFTCRSFS